MKNKNLILLQTQYLLALPSICSTLCHSPANCGTHDMTPISNLRWERVSLWVKSLVIFQCPCRNGVRKIVTTIETQKIKQIIYYYNFYSTLIFEWKISCYPYYFWSKQKYLLSFMSFQIFIFIFKFACTKLANTSD